MTAKGDKMHQVAVASTTTHPGLESGVLDAWLHRALAERFDSTLDEALPADLAMLLSGLH